MTKNQRLYTDGLLHGAWVGLCLTALQPHIYGVEKFTANILNKSSTWMYHWQGFVIIMVLLAIITLIIVHEIRKAGK
jgi:hypothetical protein